MVTVDDVEQRRGELGWWRRARAGWRVKRLRGMQDPRAPDVPEELRPELERVGARPVGWAKEQVYFVDPAGHVAAIAGWRGSKQVFSALTVFDDGLVVHTYPEASRYDTSDQRRLVRLPRDRIEGALDYHYAAVEYHRSLGRRPVEISSADDCERVFRHQWAYAEPVGEFVAPLV